MGEEQGIFYDGETIWYNIVLVNCTKNVFYTGISVTWYDFFNYRTDVLGCLVHCPDAVYDL